MPQVQDLDVNKFTFTNAPANAYEDSNSKHYKCCCGQFHVRSGTKYLIIIQIIAALVNLISAAIWTHWMQLPLLLVWIAVLALGLYGVFKYSPMGLIPLMVVQALLTLIFLIGAMFIVGVMAGADFLSKYYGSNAAVSNTDATTTVDSVEEKVDDGKASIHLLSAFLLATCLCVAAVYVWFLTIYYGCLKYIQIRGHMEHMALGRPRLP